MIFFEPLLFILLLFHTSTLLSFSLFPSCYLFSTSPQFFLLIPFFSLPPPPFSFSFLILGLRSLIKLGGTRVWRRGGSKWKGLGVLELTTGVTAALGKKNQVEMGLKQRHCAISLFMVLSPLGNGDDWKWGSTTGMNTLSQWCLEEGPFEQLRSSELRKCLRVELFLL